MTVLFPDRRCISASQTWNYNSANNSATPFSAACFLKLTWVAKYVFFAYGNHSRLHFYETLCSKMFAVFSMLLLAVSFNQVSIARRSCTFTRSNKRFQWKISWRTRKLKKKKLSVANPQGANFCELWQKTPTLVQF